VRCSFPSLALLFVLSACSSSSSDTTAPGKDAAVDVIDDEDTSPKPPFDPALFDCRSLAKGPPARKAASTPECLRDPKCTTRLVSGHRGAGGDLGRIAPEDTLAAYRAAIVLGVDIVETDPRPTKDGVLVNLHDPDLGRTTNGATGAVDEHTFDEIRALTIKTDLPGDWSCEKVPTLRELLELCRGRALVLVDANKTDRVDLLVAAIRDADALDWAIFDTSSITKIDQALAIEPRLMIQPRIEAEADAATILAHFASHVPTFVEVSSKIFPKTADLVHAAGTRVLTDVFTTDIPVKLGTAEPSQYLSVYAQGADVLQSDLPDLVLGALGRPVPPP
jgi:glycerophosphoryl diester phosphodiesterase